MLAKRGRTAVGLLGADCSRAKQAHHEVQHPQTIEFLDIQCIYTKYMFFLLKIINILLQIISNITTRSTYQTWTFQGPAEPTVNPKREPPLKKRFPSYSSGFKKVHSAIGAILALPWLTFFAFSIPTPLLGLALPQPQQGQDEASLRRLCCVIVILRYIAVSLQSAGSPRNIHLNKRPSIRNHDINKDIVYMQES